MALHIYPRIAGRSLTASCGHRVEKGSRYVRTIDYCNYNRIAKSFCSSCWNGQSGLQVQKHELPLLGVLVELAELSPHVQTSEEQEALHNITALLTGPDLGAS